MQSYKFSSLIPSLIISVSFHQKSPYFDFLKDIMYKEKSPNLGVFGGNIRGPMADFRYPTGIRLNTKESINIGKTYVSPH